MAFCQFCGKELAEEEVCDCKKSNDAVNGDSSEKSGGFDVNKLLNSKYVVIAALVVFLVIIIAIISAIGSGGYKKAIGTYVDALANCDGKKMVDVTFTEKMLKKAEKDEDIDYEDLCDQMEELLEYTHEFLEEEYGDDIKIKFKVEDKEELDEDEIEELEDEYKDEFDCKVKIVKAYEVDCVLKIQGEDDDDEEDSTIVVIKVEGEGWKVYYNAIM